MLAGVSADYYIRLEQGRDQHPSTQVLDALARALQLDEDATAHLHRLAEPPAQRRRRSSRPERVPACDHTADHVVADDSRVRVRSLPRRARRQPAGDRARALVHRRREPRQGRIPRSAAARAKARLGAVARGTVAALRANVGPDIDDPRLTELVGELSLRSEEFRQLWARHDAQPKGSGTSVMHHPQVGGLELSYTKLPIPDSDRQTLSIYHAAPKSASERALALLATTTVREREPERTLRD